MENEEYLDIKEGLSVGTMKIGNKYEIFTEEEIDAINNKIPELDERVGEISSSLENKRDKHDKINQLDLDISSDINKIQPHNLSDNVINMITGNALVSPIVGNKSITFEKTAFFNLAHRNLIDEKALTYGYAVSHVNGEITENETYKVTDFIPIHEGLTYYFSNNNHVAFYDKNRNFIESLIGAQWSPPYKIPYGKNICYMRVNFRINEKSYIYEDENIDIYYPYGDYELEINDESLLNLITQIKKPVETIDCFKSIINLFDINKIGEVDTAISPNNGGITQYEGYTTSDFMPVKGGKPYSCTRRYNIAFYDMNKEFIEGHRGSQWENGIIAPLNARYIRITIKSTDENIMFVESESLPNTYYPYGAYLEFKDDNTKQMFIDMLGFNDVFTELDERVGIIEDEIEEINSSSDGFRDSKLKGIKWNVLGDSITSTNYSRPNWWEIIQSKCGVVINNYAKSGTTLAHDETKHASKGECMCERYVNMSDDADLITIMGSTNDSAVPLGEWNSTDISTFYGALNVLITGLMEKYPNKTVAFFTPIQTATCYKSNVANASSELDKKTSTSTLSVQLRAEAIKRKCNQYGLPCLDLFNSSGINGLKLNLYRDGDRLHPSEEGNAKMSVIIENFILSLM